MGRLALIADSLGERNIAAGIRSRMKGVLAPWLAGTNANKLQYDPVWGGICSSAGLADGGADFGNGLYNECVPVQCPQGPCHLLGLGPAPRQGNAALPLPAFVCHLSGAIWLPLLWHQQSACTVC